MSDSVKRINRFFRHAVKRDVDGLPEQLLLTERQYRIYSMFYIERKSIDIIAYSVNLSARAVEKELRLIRRKIINHMDL